MKRKLLTHAALGGTVCSVVAFAKITAAQEAPPEPGETVMTFGIYERLETGRNLGLDVPERGHGTILSTIFTFGLERETPIDSISLDATTALRFSNLPERGSEVDFGDSRLLFDYVRDAANSGLDLRANYLGYDIGFQRSLSTFINDEGILELPSDFADLTGDGTRRAFGARARFDSGRQNLIGYNFSLRTNNIRYSDVTDDDLFDQDTLEGIVGLTFSLSPRTSASISLDHEHFTRDDPDETRRDTDDLLFGLSHEVTSRYRYDVVLGYSRIDERRLSGDTLTEGYVGGLALEYDTPNGVLTADINSTLETDGRVDRLTVGRRDVALPGGAVSADFGAARVPGGDVDWIGFLNYTQEFGPNEIRAQLRRDVSTNANNELRTATVADFGYARWITPVSRIGLGAIYALTDETSTDPRVERTEVSAVYSHLLTEDWNLNTGVNYRIRDEEGLGESKSPQLFFQLGRDFAWRP